MEAQLLTCAKTRVFNPDDPSKLLKINSFFDKGAVPHCWVTKRLAESLQLKENPCHVWVTVFDTIPQKKESADVRLGLRLSDGTHHYIDCKVVDKISPKPVKAIIAYSSDRKVNLDTDFLVPSFVEIDLLLDQRHCDIIKEDEGRRRLNSGFKLVPSKIGNLISGYG
uniref:Peptidase aspartic putative domain-containing protein n=1 Tax=Acrobeloides nanus TaxID=290746 RepID=A0A914CLH3_9BILA